MSVFYCLEYMLQQHVINMLKVKPKKMQINKNNKTKPENLMKKEYTESLEKLKQEIKENQEK